MEAVIHHAKGLGSLFYLVDPYETSYEKVEDIPKPNWTTKALPYFMGLLVLEHILLVMQGKGGVRLNDGIMSAANGAFMQLKNILLRGSLMSIYIYIYENWRLFELPWQSIWTWIIAAVFVDFAYYWGHRASHELNILWAAHQVHHSSEEYNLSTAVRQSAFQAFGTMIFYYPAAICIPPTHVIVHMEFNLLYQFWIHTEVVETIGPLEYILNTPQHHRIHHGSNRYCLDKNYAGVLIIWDRIFGTFEAEKPNERIVYGLVDQPQFFNPLKHQLFYYQKVYEKGKSMDSWQDKVSAFLKGPGWFPGTARLGDLTQVPEVPERQKYNPRVPAWISVYCVTHFIGALLVLDYVGKNYEAMSVVGSILAVLFLLWTLTNLGLIFDKDPKAWMLETVRCLAVVVLCFIGIKSSSEMVASSSMVTTIFIISFTLAAGGLIVDNRKVILSGKKIS